MAELENWNIFQGNEFTRRRNFQRNDQDPDNQKRESQFGCELKGHEKRRSNLWKVVIPKRWQEESKRLTYYWAEKEKPKEKGKWKEEEERAACKDNLWWIGGNESFLDLTRNV